MTLGLTPHPASLEVLYEDNHLLVVNKPAGLLAQGDHTGDPPLADLAARYIKEKYNKPGAAFIGVVHRLDRPVSGVVVLARTSKALSRMNRLFGLRETTKTYLAITARRPDADEARLVHWLKKDEIRNKVSVHDSAIPGALQAELTYRVLRPVRHGWLIEVSPLTGRPHQIRAQLASVGAPIIGDVKYGGPPMPDYHGIYLHALKLAFMHPVRKEPMSFTAPLPAQGLWLHVE
jgi:23S rRNA pseudouridine1911/1915/1917 synthase